MDMSNSFAALGDPTRGPNGEAVGRLSMRSAHASSAAMAYPGGVKWDTFPVRWLAAPQDTIPIKPEKPTREMTYKELQRSLALNALQAPQNTMDARVVQLLGREHARSWPSRGRSGGHSRGRRPFRRRRCSPRNRRLGVLVRARGDQLDEERAGPRPRGVPDHARTAAQRAWNCAALATRVGRSRGRSRLQHRTLAATPASGGRRRPDRGNRQVCYDLAATGRRPMESRLRHGLRWHSPGCSYSSLYAVYRRVLGLADKLEGFYQATFSDAAVEAGPLLGGTEEGAPLPAGTVIPERRP
jgi:hypothetical protein